MWPIDMYDEVSKQMEKFISIQTIKSIKLY